MTRVMRNQNDPYWAWHRLMEFEFGKASEYPCFAKCGREALDWALKAEHVSPDLYGQRHFIEDPTAYEPLCRGCHLRRDRAGVVLSDEARAKISAVQQARFAANPMSAETKAKISAAATGKVRTPEQRENYRRAAIKREALKRLI